MRLARGALSECEVSAPHPGGFARGGKNVVYADPEPDQVVGSNLHLQRSEDRGTAAPRRSGRRASIECGAADTAPDLKSYPPGRLPIINLTHRGERRTADRR
jgi:hypothetical protein